MPVLTRSWSVAAAAAFSAFAVLASPATARADMFAPIWNGAYIGFHGGGTWSDVDFTNIGTADSSDLTGGGHAGFNMSFGSLIAGIEGDVNYDGSSFGYLLGDGTLGSLDVDWSGSVRGRIGTNVGPALLYATAGFAWKEMSLVETSLAGVSASSSETFTGVVYGVGAETFVMPNLSLRLEALHYDYGSEKLSIGGAVDAIQEIDPSETVVRAGVTFHLN